MPSHKLSTLLLLAAVVLTGCAMHPMSKEDGWEPDCPLPRIPDRSVRITDFGAVPDGKTLARKAIADAIADCARKGGGRVVVPAGTFLTGPIVLANNIDLHLEQGATLRFSDDFSLYPIGGFKPLPDRHQSLITLADGHDASITGEGTIDGQGKKWWDDFLPHKKEAGYVERRPKGIVFDHCTRVMVKGITMINAPMFNMSPTSSQDVMIDGVKVFAPDESPNTDSCNPSGWNIHIRNCHFDTGDDNVAVKPFVKPGDGRLSVEGLYIRDCTFVHGHGLSVGGQTPGGLRKMRVRDCTFENTDNGIRLKAERGAGGLVEDIVYENITMKNVKNAIVITSYYHGLPKVGQEHETKPVDDKTPIWRNIVIRNLKAVGSDSAGLLMGLPEMPLEGITLQNVRITAKNPLRVGYAQRLKFETVRIDVASGEPLLIEENVDLKPTK